MNTQDLDQLYSAALLGALCREQGPAQHELGSSPMAGAFPRTTAGDRHSRAAWLPRHRGTSVHDKCFCTSCHRGQSEAPGGGPRTPQGCSAVAEREVRGVSAELGCCPAPMAGEWNAHLCWMCSGSELRGSTQATAFPPTGPGCWAEIPVFSHPVFFSLIPIEASRVSVSLKSERNLMLKLNSIQFP